MKLINPTAINNILILTIISCLLLGCEQRTSDGAPGKRNASALEEAIFDNSPLRTRELLRSDLPKSFKTVDGVELVRFTLSEELVGNHGDESVKKVLSDSDNILRQLLDAGVEVNIKTRDGSPVIYTAIANNRVFAVNELLKRGAEINSYDNSGWSPLMLAVYHCNLPIVNLLIESGAQIDLRNNRGESAFSIAQEKCKSSLPLERKKQG